MNYGYARVSTREQNLDRQIKALTVAGIDNRRIFSDKQSGKNFDRPQYKRLVKRMKPGDVLFVKELDRLGRNYSEIIEQWRYLSKVKGIDLVVLDMPLLDTRQSVAGLTGTFITDMVLQVLSYVADVERQKNKTRQAEGIAIARAKGVKFGRPPKDIPANFNETAAKYLHGSLSSRRAAAECDLSQTTFLRMIKKLECEQKIEKRVIRNVDYIVHYP